MTTKHATIVRSLYKGILKLHRGMPSEMRAIGDQYVKDEFRRHKNVGQEEAAKFLGAWTEYYVTVAKQLAARKKQQTYGKEIPDQDLTQFNEEQLGQLYVLKDEATRPKDPENPFGEHPLDKKSDWKLSERFDKKQK